MRARAAAAAIAVLVACALAAPAASAHPLGNFSVNHLTKVRVSADRGDVDYVLDSPRSRPSRTAGPRRRSGSAPCARRRCATSR